MSYCHRILLLLSFFTCITVGQAKPEPTPDQTSGTITGIIVQKDGPKITVEAPEQRLKLIPHWRGGMPKDGGGFDEKIVKKLERYEVGDSVQIEWEFSEHYRINSIRRAPK